MKIDPSTQEILFEHKKIFEDLSKLYNNNDLPNKILFSGEKGIGKSTLAYHFTNFVLSKDEDYSYDNINNVINKKNKSYILLQNECNPNINVIDLIEDKKNISINQIRELIINLNKSSFNNKPRFVLIDNIDLLNISSVNALLKILEEPNENIYFILINNNKKVLPTLKSRCLDFKVFLTNEKSIYIINQLVEDDIQNIISNDIFDFYITPGKFLKLYKFSKEYDLDLSKINLKKLLKMIIKDKMYKKDMHIKAISYSLIELFFRTNISANNTKLFGLYHYFLKKINNTKIYNLDDETMFIEFDDKILNG